MRVLHINQSDTVGGAAILSYRLHRTLIEQGIDSKMLVALPKTADERVAKVPPPGLLELIVGRVIRQLGPQDVHLRTARNLADHPWVREADVIQLHNLHEGYFNYRHLPAIVGNKPVILMPHDMWSFTGHCGYSFDCERYVTGCGKCPYLNTYPPMKRDATALEWKWKERAYHQLRLQITPSSRWSAECIGRSMLKEYPLHLIPLGLNLKSYRPLDRAACRSALGIEAGRPVIMFAAAALNDARKGADLMLAALRLLPESLRTTALLLTMGSGGETLPGMAGMSSLNLGYIEGDRIKAIAYNIADVFVFPTRADVFGLVVLESIACGTPVCSFRVGGVPDLVRPGITGLLAPPEDAAALAANIEQILRTPLEMRNKCREVAETEYSDRLMATRYIDVYQKALAAPV